MQHWTPLNPWIETVGVVLLGVVGVALGRWFSRLERPYWTLGYFVPLVLIILIGLAYRIRALEFIPPFSWLMAGRTEFALTALIGTMVLTTPLSRLPRRRDRVAIRVLSGLSSGGLAVPGAGVQPRRTRWVENADRFRRRLP